MKIKLLFIFFLLILGAFQVMSQDELCEINFDNIEQNCSDDGTSDISFNLSIDFPNPSPCEISKIEIVQSSVIGLPPLKDPQTVLYIENYSPNGNYTISGAVPGRTNCYKINLIDQDGNVCCCAVVCVDVDCCPLNVDIKATCAPDGIVIVNINGGNPPFTVYGANLADSDNPYLYEDSDLDAGTYDLSITDSNGCTFEDTYTIYEAGSEECCDIEVDIKTTCAPDGIVIVNITGGSPPFTVYGASLADSDNPYLYEDSDLEAGTYNLSITDSNGCTYEDTYTILENDVTVEWKFNGCSPDGYIAVYVNGGSGNYHVIGAALADSDDPTYYEEEELDPGTYPLIVTDKETGCVLKTYYTVPEPLNVADIEWNYEECQITVTIAGGTPDYVYLGPSDNTPTNPFVIDLGTDSNISSLPVDLIFEDANGCQIIYTLTTKNVPKRIIDCINGIKFKSTKIDIRSKINHEDSSTNKFNLFPSPATDVLNVTILDDLGNSSVLSIIDNTGKTVMTKNLSDEKHLRLDMSTIPPGIYFLQLRNEDGNPIGKKFVKN